MSVGANRASRDVIVGDVARQMPQLEEKDAVVLSPPDLGEFEQGMSEADYEAWLTNLSWRLSVSVDPAMPVIWYVTDRYVGGRIIHKPSIIAGAAPLLRTVLLSIVLRGRSDAISRYQPSWGSLLGLSQRAPREPATKVPSIIDATHGNVTGWRRSTPWQAALHAAAYARSCGAERIVNPFCGMGTFLLAANEVGLDAVGIEIDEERAAVARGLGC